MVPCFDLLTILMILSSFYRGAAFTDGDISLYEPA